MDLQKVKYYIDNLGGKSKEDVLRILGNDEKLSDPEKNTVYLFLFGGKLLDRELPGRIQSARGRNVAGYLVPEDSEIVLLIMAYKSKQYNRYILHLLHAFTDPSKVFPLSGRFRETCGLCDKMIYHHEVWSEECKKFPQLGEQDKKEFLAYGSRESSIELCLDCLVQLQALNDVLKVLEGPNYLNPGWVK